MISNDDGSDGDLLHYNPRNIGSLWPVRVGSRGPSHPLVIVTLGVLNTVLLVAAIVIGIYCGNASEIPPPEQITAQALIVEVKQLQILQTQALQAQKEAEQALEKEVESHKLSKVLLRQNNTNSDNSQTQLEALRLEKAMLQSSVSDIDHNCGRCPSGWFLFNTSCYFHSKSASLAPTTWLDSKADCINRGARLVVIETLEEQLNLYEFLPKLDPSIRPWYSRPGGAWMGLTDVDMEGQWVWINNEPLQEQTFWISGEPNNVGALGEDCAATINVKNPRATWFDASCRERKDWLCEKEPLN